jgi:hypothetical protein
MAGADGEEKFEFFESKKRKKYRAKYRKRVPLRKTPMD